MRFSKSCERDFTDLIQAQLFSCAYLTNVQRSYLEKVLKPEITISLRIDSQKGTAANSENSEILSL